LDLPAARCLGESLDVIHILADEPARHSAGARLRRGLFSGGGTRRFEMARPESRCYSRSAQIF